MTSTRVLVKPLLYQAAPAHCWCPHFTSHPNQTGNWTLTKTFLPWGPPGRGGTPRLPPRAAPDHPLLCPGPTSPGQEPGSRAAGAPGCAEPGQAHNRESSSGTAAGLGLVVTCKAEVLFYINCQSLILIGALCVLRADRCSVLGGYFFPLYHPKARFLANSSSASPGCRDLNQL